MKRLAVLLLCAACGDGARLVDVADQLSVRRESAHFVYLTSPGDWVDDWWMEQYHDWLMPQLGVRPGARYEYHKYRDRAHMRDVTGRATNGFAEPGTNRFHSIWSKDNHEVVHSVVIRFLGHPPALFNEGVAVAHQMIPDQGVFYAQWNSVNVHVIAAEHLAEGAIPALASLIESHRFFAAEEGVTYPLAGSFVRWLIDTHGMARFHGLLRGASYFDTAFITRTRFRKAYGIPLEQAWADWQSFLAELPPPSSIATGPAVRAPVP